MSGIINYDVTINPSKPKVSLGVSTTATKLTAKTNSLGFSLDVKPATGTIVAGAVAGVIVGAFAGPAGALLGGGAGVGAIYGVAELLKSQLESAIKDNVVGKTQDHYYMGKPPEGQEAKPLGYSFEVEGVTVRVEAATLSLSTYNGMLMATGTAKVT